MATILIVDDEEPIRTLLRYVLEKARYTVVEATNGMEAIKLFRRHPVDLVITDLFMPTQDGLETIPALRGLNPRLPIIAMSGGGSAAQFDLLHTAQVFGATQVLLKPFRVENVLETVRSLLPENSSATLAEPDEGQKA